MAHAVGELQDELGVVLFHRHGPRVQITPAGEELLNAGRARLPAADDLGCRVERSANGQESEIHLALDTLIPCIMFGASPECSCADMQGTRVKPMGHAMTGVRGWLPGG